MVVENIIPLDTPEIINTSVGPAVVQYVKSVEVINPWTYVMWGLIIVGAIILLALLIRYHQKRMELGIDKKPSPLASATIVSLAIVVILVIIMFLTGTRLKPLYIFGIFAAVFFIVYLTMWNEIRKLKPIKTEKLLILAWEHLDKISLAKPHKGDAFGSPVVAFNKTIVKEQDPPFNMLFHSLLRTNIEGVTFVYLAQSMTDGEPTKYIEHPDSKMIERFLGKEAAEAYDFEKALIQESMNPASPIQQPQTQNEQHQTKAIETD